MASRDTRGRLLALAALVPALLGARLYRTEAQVLEQVFPEATSIRPQIFDLDEPLLARLEGRLGYRPRERLLVIHEALRGDERQGYAIVMNEVGKVLPITFLVAIRPGGTVNQVVLMAFREPRGYEVERKVFRNQFRGKSVLDPIRRGRDIRNISGATLSVDAMARGVKRALALFDELATRSPQIVESASLDRDSR